MMSGTAACPGCRDSGLACSPSDEKTRPWHWLALAGIDWHWLALASTGWHWHMQSGGPDLSKEFILSCLVSGSSSESIAKLAVTLGMVPGTTTCHWEIPGT